MFNINRRPVRVRTRINDLVRHTWRFRSRADGKEEGPVGVALWPLGRSVLSTLESVGSGRIFDTYKPKLVDGAMERQHIRTVPGT